MTTRTTLATGIALALVLVPSARTQAPRFEEFHRMFPPVAGDTRDVAAGDVDGDGDADLLLAWASRGCELRLNDGAGTFRSAPERLPTLSINAVVVELADLDGDGDLDAIVGTSDPARNWILVNDGTGNFQTALAALPPSTDTTYSLAVGDVDGDLDLDIVFGNRGTNRLLRNDGAGSFTDVSAQLPAHGFATWALALVDVDGDHDLDLVAGNDIGEPNNLSLNDGLGNFVDASANLPSLSDRTRGIAFGDVDGDGDADLLLATNFGQNHLFLNGGGGVFGDASAALPTRSEPSQAVALGDVDGDGDLDAYVGNANSAGYRDRLLLGDGTGTFADASGRIPSRAERTASVALVDVDGDGDLDAVLGLGWFQEDDDALLLNDGHGNFVDTTPDTGLGLSARDLLLVDVDADGDADLVAAYTGRNRLFRNDGTGVFHEDPAALPPDADDSRALAAGDLDGDGDADLVVGNGLGSPAAPRDGRNRLYLNDGSGSFSEAIGFLPLRYELTSDLALADVNGDGDLDLVCANHGQNRLFLNRGDGSFWEGTARFPLDADLTNCVAFGDLDGDGFPDLLLGNDVGLGRLYLNDGTGSFFDASATNLPSIAGGQTEDVLLFDRDGDGDSDALLLHFFGGVSYLSYLENAGNGSFTDARATLPSPQIFGSRQMAAGDFDGDGDPDLYFAHWGSSPSLRNLLWRNDGAAGFTDVSQQLPASDHAREDVAVADLDGDQDLDLVVGGFGSLRIYANLEDQIGWHGWPRIHKLFELELYGPPAAPWILVAATRAARTPVPGLGTLGIDLASVVATVAGSFDGSGEARLAWTVPDDPLLVGATLWLQALRQPGRLSNLERTTLREL